MESLEGQQGRPRHGAAHLHPRRGSREFACAGSLQVKEKAHAACGGRCGKRGSRRKSQLSLFLLMNYRQPRDMKDLRLWFAMALLAASPAVYSREYRRMLDNSRRVR